MYEKLSQRNNLNYIVQYSAWMYNNAKTPSSTVRVDVGSCVVFKELFSNFHLSSSPCDFDRTEEKRRDLKITPTPTSTTKWIFWSHLVHPKSIWKFNYNCKHTASMSLFDSLVFRMNFDGRIWKLHHLGSNFVNISTHTSSVGPFKWHFCLQRCAHAFDMN